MIRTEYFKDQAALNAYYPDGVPSTVVAVIGDNQGVVLGKSNNNPYSESNESVNVGGGSDTDNEIVECFANILTGHFFQNPYDTLENVDELRGNVLESSWSKGSILDTYGQAFTAMFALPVLTQTMNPSDAYCTESGIIMYNGWEAFTAKQSYLVQGIKNCWQDVYFTSFQTPDDFDWPDDFFDYMLCGDMSDGVELSLVKTSEFMTTKFPLLYYIGPRWAARRALEEFNALREQLMPNA